MLVLCAAEVADEDADQEKGTSDEDSTDHEALTSSSTSLHQHRIGVHRLDRVKSDKDEGTDKQMCACVCVCLIIYIDNKLIPVNVSSVIVNLIFA